MKRTLGMGLALLGMAIVAGCATAPKGEQAKADLHRNVQNTIKTYEGKDAGMRQFLDNAYGYAVFPSIGKGGVIVGGAYGRGEVYEQGKLIGYAELSQASVGLQLGGQTFSEIIVFKNAQALNNLREGRLNFSANVSAVALKSGASAAANYRNGVAVFTNPNGGAMFEASIGGQKFDYQDISTARQIDQGGNANNQNNNMRDND